MEITVRMVNAFTDGDAGGNPAGVVTEADGLTREQKQQVARKVGKSETAFLSRTPEADFYVEFFTPTRQIAQCGHATVGLAGLLREEGLFGGEELRLETHDGLRTVFLEGDRVFMEQRFRNIEPMSNGQIEAMAASLGLEMTELLPEYPATIVDSGNRFLMVPVKRQSILAKIQPDQSRIEALSDQWDLIGYYVYTPETENNERDATARMFAPAYGITEESATGIGAGALSAYLHEYQENPESEYFIEQGRFMDPPSPSLIEVRMSAGGDPEPAMFAGGTVKLIERLTVALT